MDIVEDSKLFLFFSICFGLAKEEIKNAIHTVFFFVFMSSVTLTHTGVGSHTPGEGADLSSVLRLPQALQLCKFAGCTNERAQALKKRGERFGMQ